MSHPGLLHLHVLSDGDVANIRRLCWSPAIGCANPTLDMGHLVHMPTHIDIQWATTATRMHWNQEIRGPRIASSTTAPGAAEFLLRLSHRWTLLDWTTAMGLLRVVVDLCLARPVGFPGLRWRISPPVLPPGNVPGECLRARGEALCKIFWCQQQCRRDWRWPPGSSLTPPAWSLQRR